MTQKKDEIVAAKRESRQHDLLHAKHKTSIWTKS